jgi:hypothetical protein
MRTAVEFYKHPHGWFNRLIAGGFSSGHELPFGEGRHGRPMKIDALKSTIDEVINYYEVEKNQECSGHGSHPEA